MDARVGDEVAGTKTYDVTGDPSPLRVRGVDCR